MKLPDFLLSSTLLLLLSLSVQAQNASPQLHYQGILSAAEMRALQSQEKMMCTAVPALTILNCRADDRDNPNGAQVGRIEWRVEGGMNPFFVELVHSSGQTFTVVGGTGPNGNLFTAPRDFSLTNTTTAATCVPGGGYTIRITDAENCIVTCMITFNPTCFNYDNSTTPTVTAADCDNPTGSINIGNIPDAYCNTDPSAGSVSYAWSDGGPSTPNRTGLPPGFYSVTVTDFYGCTGVFNNIEVPDNTAGAEILPGSCGFDPPTLVGGTNGQIYFNISNGTAPFDITWTGPSSGGPISGSLGPNAINGLGAGTYTITVEDSNGCLDDCTVTIDDAVCSLMANCPSGPNANNSVTITYSGGTGPYFISYFGPVNGSGSSTGGSYTSPVLPTGNYNFYVQDANGGNCEIECFVSITAPDCSTLALASSQVVQPACNGSFGSIDLNVTGGNPAYTFSWTGPNGFTSLLEDINNLTPGTYTVTISDNAACTTIPPTSFTITQPDVLAIDCSFTAADFGMNNGSVSVGITGGTPPYQISYNGTVVDPYSSGTVIGNLAPNFYLIVVLDANGCAAGCSLTIPAVSCDLSVSSMVTQPACPGESSGSISLSLTDVAGDSSIVWSVPGFDNQTSLGNLSAGNYYAVVGDDNCTLDTLRFTLSDPLALSVDISLLSPINCFGDSTASLLATLSQGVAPFTYNWLSSSQPDTNRIAALPAGQYSLEVTDANGCIGRDTIVVNQPGELSLSCSATGESSSGANDGSIVLAFGQTGNSTAPYSISGDHSATGLTAADSPVNLMNLAPGTYNFIFTDSNGCEERCSATVNVGGCIMTLSGEANQPNCATPNQGSLVVTPMNGTFPFTYAWTGSSSTDSIANNLAPGNYSVFVTDANGCTATYMNTLNAFSAFPSRSIQTQAAICEAACATYLVNLDGQAPFSLAYYIRDATNTPLFNGNFQIQTTADTLLEICPALLGRSSLEGLSIAFTQLTDGLCATNDTLVFPVQIYPLATDTIRQNFCNGDTPSFGGQLFDQTNPYAEILFSNQSANGCDSLLVVDLSFFAAVPGSIDTTICIGSSIVLEGQVFDASNNGTSFTSSSLSSLGCDSIVTVNLSFFPAVSRLLDTTLCEGASLQLEGNVFNASNPSGSFISAIPSSNGCDSLVTVTVSFFPVPMGSLDTTICSGSSLTLLGQTFDAANPTGTVTLAAASASGCDSLVTVRVNFLAPLVLELLNIRGGCNQPTYDLEFSYSGSGSVEVNISNATPSTFILSPGVNTVAVSPTGSSISLLSATSLSEACAVLVSGSVSVPVAPTIAINILSGNTANDAISCANATDGVLQAVLSGSDLNGYSYLWSNGRVGALASNLGAGTYSVTATNVAGCSVSSSISLTAPSPIRFTSRTQAASCLGAVASIEIDSIEGGSGPYTYRLQSAAFVAVGSLPFTITAPPGTVLLEIEDSNGCSSSQSLQLSAAPEGRVVILPGDTVIRLGDSLSLRGQTNLSPAIVRWSPVEDTSSLQSLIRWVRPNANTTYSLLVVDENGCSATAEVLVRVDRRVPIYAPNAFSPNGDGVNDRFSFYGEQGIISYHDLVIFDRWGEVVYQAKGDLSPNDPNWAWDGMHRGELLNPAVFIYRLFVTLADGRKELLQGEVTLLR